tara:strand:+ start:3121 stop:3651 length:531 start_codon:yes stop_codon:yes gene_type:complete
MPTLNVITTTFATKVNGQELIVDFAKMHPTWINAYLRKATQRYLNDDMAGLEPSVKLAATIDALKEIHSGNPMPEKTRRAAGTGKASDPVLDLALKNAKLALSAMFKAATKLVKMSDMVAASPKVAAYFTAKGETQVWREDVVIGWMETQTESGKRDFMQEARDTLETVDEEALDF